MKTFLPWLLVILLAVGLSYTVHRDNQKEIELSQLRAQAADITNLKSQVEELRQVPTDKEELARLRRENAEIHQLRNKVSQLEKNASGATSKRATANIAYDPNVPLTAEQVQQLIRENQQLRSESQEFHLIRERDAVNTCINHLRQLDGATDQWAIENKKSTGEMVTLKDLLPYLRGEQIPQCPAGGAYSVTAVGQPPTCSVPGHVLP